MDLWTGVACLVADPNCKVFRRFGDDGKGAYVNVVAWADSAEDFQKRVNRVARELDCLLLELNNVQLLEKRIEDPDSPDELLEMRTTATRQPQDTVFGTFHIWTQSDVS